MEVETTRAKPGNVYEFTPEGIRRSSVGGKAKKGPSKTSIILGVVCVILFVAVIILLVFLVDAIKDNEEDDSSATARSVCVTEDCVSAAARISSFIDRRVEPCDDFYKFACGGWLESTVVPDNEVDVDSFSSLQDQVDVTIKSLLEADKIHSELRSFREAKVFYKSCMNKTQINFVTFNDLKRSLHELGDLPLVTDLWSGERFNPNSALISLSELATPPFFDLSLAVDPRQPTKNILEFGLVGGWYIPYHEMASEYRNRILQITEELGSNKERLDDILKVRSFHEQLLKNVEKCPREATQKSVTDLQTSYSNVIDWRQFVVSVLRRAGVEISPSERILVECPARVSELMTLVNNTDKKTLANFMLLNFVFSFVNQLGDKYKSEFMRDKDTADAYSVSDSLARYKFCVHETLMARGRAVATVYIKQQFDHGSKSPILNLTKEIRTSFKESLKEVDWMDDKGKKMIGERIDNMTIIVGYPQELNQTLYADRYYSPYTFDEKAFFNNSMAVRAENFRQTFKGLRAERSALESQLLPYKLAIGYDRHLNLFYVSVALLQPPVFTTNYTKYLLYGSMGAAFAYGVIRGFDESVASDEPTENPYWNNVSRQKYGSRTGCFKEQLDKLQDPVTGSKFNVTTKSYIRFHVALSDGITLAHKAYKTWLANQKSGELPLPGLNYTQDQLFFLTFAQLTCEKRTHRNDLTQLPMHFTLNEVYKNSPEFARVFKCSPQSVMNPKNRCAVWVKHPTV